MVRAAHDLDGADALLGEPADTVVIDEPLYGFYLARTSVQHPGRDEIIQSMTNGWREVISELTLAPFPPGRPFTTRST